MLSAGASIIVITDWIYDAVYTNITHPLIDWFIDWIIHGFFSCYYSPLLVSIVICPLSNKFTFWLYSYIYRAVLYPKSGAFGTLLSWTLRALYSQHKFTSIIHVKVLNTLYHFNACFLIKAFPITGGVVYEGHIDRWIDVLDAGRWSGVPFGSSYKFERWTSIIGSTCNSESSVTTAKLCDRKITWLLG